MNNDILTDISPEVNYEKSINKNRLVYVNTPSYVIMHVLWLIFMLPIMLLGPCILLSALHKGDQGGVIFGIFILPVSIWLIAGFFFKNAVVKIEGTNLEQNKQNIIDTLNAFYDDLEFQVDNGEILRSKKPSGKPIWGRMITVMFNNDEMLLNISTIGKHQDITVVHGYTNYLKAKKIAEYFQSQF
jgi:hypothetical protein